MLEEDLADELAAAADTGFVEDRLEMIPDGAETGWRFVAHEQLAGPQSPVITQAV